MACTISISDQPNNSLGQCWLCKFEDDYTGELYDKCLYPKSDFQAIDAIHAFIEDHVRDDEVDVEEIYLLDSSKDDPDAAAFAMTYKARFGVEYRNMHTAIHGIFVFDDEQEARRCADELDVAETGDDGDEAVRNAFKSASDHIEEIDFRDVDSFMLPTGDLWRRYDDGEHGVLVVNDIAFDLYI